MRVINMTCFIAMEMMFFDGNVGFGLLHKFLVYVILFEEKRDGMYRYAKIWKSEHHNTF